MPKIYLVIGYNYGYTRIKNAYRNRKVAEITAGLLDVSDNTYIHGVKEIELIEEDED